MRGKTWSLAKGMNGQSPSVARDATGATVGAGFQNKVESRGKPSWVAPELVVWS